MKYYFIIILTFTLSRVCFSQNTVIECNDFPRATSLLKEVGYQEAIETILKDKIEACSKEKRNTNLVASKINPFIGALHYAYAQHRPISIAPDMIWLLICQGFAKHVDYHAEELRSKFVSFSGKKELTVYQESTDKFFVKGGQDNPWELVFPQFAEQIQQNVGKDLCDVLISDFTTTTPTEKIASQITLMDIMHNYFEYTLDSKCGIPEIIIEGNLKDWESIKVKLNKLKGYKIDNWIDALNPIIDEFIAAKKGVINKNFWDSIYKISMGSGGGDVSGWVIKFFPYLNSADGKQLWNKYIDEEPKNKHDGWKTNFFFSGASCVDFNWKDNGHLLYEMQFVSGFIGIKQDNKTLTLRPEIGWAVKDKKK